MQDVEEEEQLLFVEQLQAAQHHFRLLYDKDRHDSDEKEEKEEETKEERKRPQSKSDVKRSSVKKDSQVANSANLE